MEITFRDESGADRLVFRVGELGFFKFDEIGRASCRERV